MTLIAKKSLFYFILFKSYFRLLNSVGTVRIKPFSKPRIIEECISVVTKPEVCWFFPAGLGLCGQTFFLLSTAILGHTVDYANI